MVNEESPRVLQDQSLTPQIEELLERRIKLGPNERELLKIDRQISDIKDQQQIQEGE